MFNVQQTTATELLNKMFICQSWLDFVEGNIASPPPKYDKKRLTLIRTGLENFNRYIQTEIIDPDVLARVGGDKALANQVQVKLDEKKALLVDSLEDHYPHNDFKFDQVMALNDCGLLSPPPAAGFDELRVSLDTMIDMLNIYPRGMD